MDFRFNKSLIVILSLSSLLLSSNAVPSTRVIDFISSSVPAPAPSSRVSKSIPEETPISDGFLQFDPASLEDPTFLSDNEATNLLGSIAANVAEKADPEVVKLCSDGDNPALCAASISKLLKGPFEPLKALEVEVDATLSQAMSVSGTITKLLKDPSTDKKAMDALDICHSQYDSMLDAIKETVELIQQQNVVDAIYKFSSVISYRTACEDAFLESPGVKMPFSQDSKTLYDLGGNCLGIMNNLVTNHKF